MRDIGETGTISATGPVSIAIKAPNLAPLEQAMTAFISLHGGLEIVDRASHAMALEIIGKCRQREKTADDETEPTRSALDMAKKQLLAYRDKIKAPYIALRAVLSAKAQSYEAAERQREDAERRKLENEAMERDKERRLLEALQAEAEGDTATAEAIVTAPVVAPIVAVPTQRATVAGVSARTTWSAEVVDFPAFARAAVAAERWELLSPNQVNLNKTATILKENFKITGARSVPKQTYATRATPVETT